MGVQVNNSPGRRRTAPTAHATPSDPRRRPVLGPSVSPVGGGATQACFSKPSPWPGRELLAMERNMLGLYIIDHPVREWTAALVAAEAIPIGELGGLEDRAKVLIGGLVTAVGRKLTRAGAPMAFTTVEDLSGAVEAIVFPKAFFKEKLLRLDEMPLFRGRLDVKDQGISVLCDQVQALPRHSAPTSEPANHVPESAESRPRAAQPGHQLAGEPPSGGNGTILHVGVRTSAELEVVQRTVIGSPDARQVMVHLGDDHDRTVGRGIAGCIVPVQSYMAWPARIEEPLPAVLVIQEVWGVDGHIQGLVRRFATAGYAALAPDLYSHGGKPSAFAPGRIEAVETFLDSAPPPYAPARPSGPSRRCSTSRRQTDSGSVPRPGYSHRQTRSSGRSVGSTRPDRRHGRSS